MSEQIHFAWVGTEDSDTRDALIQALNPLGLAAVREALEADPDRPPSGKEPQPS